jgi:uncharacterized protein involved in outer membrane biogenesis
MVRKAMLVVAAILVAGGLVLVLYARSVLASENVRRLLESQLTARLGQPVHIGAASASIYPGVTLELADVAIGSPSIVSLGSVSVETGLRGVFSRRVEDAQIRLSNGRAVLPAVLQLFAAFHATPSQPGNDNGLTIVSIELISMRDVELVLGRSSLQFDMESALTGDRLDVTRLTAKSARTQFDATGAITSLSGREGHFTVTASQLDFDELLALTSGLGAPAEPGRAADPAPSAGSLRLTLDITAPTGRLADDEFSDIAAKLESKPPRMSVNPLSLGAFGGRFDGALQVATSTSPPGIELHGKIANIDVVQLAARAGRPGSISGRLAGTLTMTAAGADATTMVRSARGSATAEVTNGVIPGLEMVRTIVLAFGKPSGAPPPGSGSAFSRITGHFTVQNGVLRSNNVTFASRDFDMAGSASLAVQSGAIDAQMDVVLSEELTAQAGTDLRRYATSDGRVIVPAHITGTLSYPRISLDLAAAIRRALENELKRRATSWLDELLRRKKGGG